MVSAMISEQILKVKCVVENIITQKCFSAKKRLFSCKEKVKYFFLRC